MARWHVTIMQPTSYVVEVEADSEQEAEAKAMAGPAPVVSRSAPNDHYPYAGEIKEVGDGSG